MADMSAADVERVHDSQVISESQETDTCVAAEEQRAFNQVGQDNISEAEQNTGDAVGSSSANVATNPTFEDQVERVRETVQGNSRYTEIEYQILKYCMQRRTLSEVEDMVVELPQYLVSDQNPYRLIVFLEDAGGLIRFDLNEEGTVVTDEAKEGLTEDEIDDLVWTYAFETTDAGAAVVEQMKPENRMEALFKLFPARVPTYCEVLEFCKQPRTWKEIDKLLEGRDVLKSGSLNWQTDVPLQPTVFIDRLEAAGGIVYDKGWKITEGGRRFLEALEKITG